MKQTSILALSGAILTGLTAIGIITVQHFEDSRIAENRRTVQQLAESAAHEIQSDVYNALATTHTTSLWIQRNSEVADFRLVAAELVDRYPGLTGIAVAPDGIVKHAYPLSDRIVGKDIRKDPKLGPYARQAESLRRMTVAGPLSQDNASNATVGCLPVFSQSSGKFWGFVIATIDLDVLLAQTNLHLLRECGYAYLLQKLAPGGESETLISSRADNVRTLDTPVTASVEVPDGEWSLYVAPDTGWTPQNRTSLSLGLVLALALLLTVLIHHLFVRGRQRKLAEAAMRDTEERYSLAVRGVNDGIWDWDLLENQLFCTARWRSMLGYTNEDTSSDPESWLRAVHPEDDAEVRLAIKSHLAGNSPHLEVEFRMADAAKEYRWMLCRGLAVRDADGIPTRMAGSLTDISDRKRVEDKLTHDALHDALTDLPNRSLFMNRLDHLVRASQRPGQAPFAVLFLDMDHFKVVNDSLGHVVGDQLLVEVADRVRNCVRPGDTVARLGGDEFAILLPELGDIHTASTVATRVQDHLRLPYDIAGQEIFASASVGIATSFSGRRKAVELLRDADTAMYRAKESGRANYAIFDDRMHHEAVERLQLETELRQALKTGDQFQLYYQPVVACLTSSLIGFEALIRWIHPERGMISPVKFIPVAEETGLITAIGQWVLNEACRQIKVWRTDYPELKELAVSVNLSPKQFKQNDLLQSIKQTLEDHELQPSAVKLEITESAIMEHVDQAAAMLTKLRSLGMEVHIDDFGTGYSSLAYLKQLPLSALKIDRSFVDSMGEESQTGCIATAIASLANDLGLKVVAEGVETQHQLDLLRALDVEYVQGYFIAKPLTAAHAEQKVAEAANRPIVIHDIDEARQRKASGVIKRTT